MSAKTGDRFTLEIKDIAFGGECARRVLGGDL